MLCRQNGEGLSAVVGGRFSNCGERGRRRRHKFPLESTTVNGILLAQRYLLQLMVGSPVFCRILLITQGGAILLDLVLVRAVLVLVFAVAAYFLHPVGVSPWVAAGAGGVFLSLIHI